MGVYYLELAGTTAGIRRSVGNCLGRTALTTSFMRQVAKVDIREARAESREGRETNPSRCSTDGRL